jgi:hypothetical protein
MDSDRATHFEHMRAHASGLRRNFASPKQTSGQRGKPAIVGAGRNTPNLTPQLGYLYTGRLLGTDPQVTIWIPSG